MHICYTRTRESGRDKGKILGEKFHQVFLVEILRNIQVIWNLPPNFIFLYVTSLGKKPPDLPSVIPSATGFQLQ